MPVISSASRSNYTMSSCDSLVTANHLRTRPSNPKTDPDLHELEETATMKVTPARI